MTDLEKKIKQLAADISESKTKKKRPKVFAKYIQEWDIVRLTEVKRAEIQTLFQKYSLEIVKPYYEDVQFDILTVEKLQPVVIMYKETQSAPEDYGKTETDDLFRPLYDVSESDCPKKPYPIQEDAYKSMTAFYNTNENKSGLLVLPTGAGKTFTAVSWLLRHVTNSRKKIIWVAHRHELLEQVSTEVGSLSFANILPNRKGEKIAVHLVSGSHDRAIWIDKHDDFLIASVQTLNRNLQTLSDNFLKHNDDVFLVIDEAHHATAKTYRNLIDTVKQSCSKYNILGLTATPFRTAEKEKSYLAKIFDPKPIYSKDLNELIVSRILAVPKFMPIKTNLSFKKEDFSAEELTLLQSNFDLPEGIKQKIVQRKDRDRIIVNHYLENIEKYKQTLVFALDKAHALQLDSLFKSKGVRSDFVISALRSEIGTSIDKEHNTKVINDFRNKELDVLVNVNILTEGTDLPKTQTVFLTRPTKSKTLMTQMVGRALRGPKARGTKDAYIVSFIDDWSNLVAWQSPSELFVDENDLTDITKDYRETKLNFISIKLLQQFANLADKTIDTSILESYPAIMRIPLGWYSFEIEIPMEDEDIDYKSCKILVYEQHKPAFDDLEDDFEALYLRYDYDENNILDAEERKDMLKEIKRKYFDSLEYPEPVVENEDLLNIIEYYDKNRSMPAFFTFEERDKYDITLLANRIINENINIFSNTDFIRNEWGGENGKSIWCEFYSTFDYFYDDLQLEIKKKIYPKQTKVIFVPEVEYKQKKLENMPLSCWQPEMYREMLEAVYEKWNSENPDNKIEKSDRWKYDIDHIHPMNKGGKTVLENLQPLLRHENRKKGDKI